MQVLETKRREQTLQPPPAQLKEQAEKQEAPKSKRPRGRPPTHSLSSEPTDKKGWHTTKTTFPRPPGGTRMKSFSAFIKYWKDLTPAMLDRTKVHTYRLWPVINPRLAGDKTNTIDVYETDPTKETSAVCPFEPDQEQWKREILHRYGAGDYRMIITELGVAGPVAQCDHISVRDIDIPPRVDPRHIVVGDPLNANYIAEQRHRGVKFPGDPGFDRENEGDEEMALAAAQMASENAKTVDKLTDKLFQVIDKTQQQQQRPDVSSLADRNAIETMSKAAEQSFNMIEKAQAKAAELQGKQVDPLQMMGALADVVEKIAPKDNGKADAFLKMMGDQAARAEEKLEALQREMRDREERRIKEDAERREREEARRIREEERRNKEEKEHAEREKPKTLVEQLREQKEINELLGIKKSKGEGDEEGDSKKEDTLETILKYMPLAVSGITTLFTLGANMLYNAKLKPGESPQPVPNAAAQQMQQQVQQIASGVSPEQAQQSEQMQMFMQQIEGPFISHFFSAELNGYTFAEHIYNSHPMQGPIAYAQMKQAGAEELIKALSTYPPIWSKVGGMQPKLHEFAAQFMNYEEWKNSTDDDDEEETEAVN